MKRGEIWWAELGEPIGSAPGFTRPVLVLQNNILNVSAIKTVLCVVLSSNIRLAQAPGNVLVSRQEAGLPSDSVVNVSQVITVDKRQLREKTGKLGNEKIGLVEDGIRFSLDLK